MLVFSYPMFDYKVGSSKITQLTIPNLIHKLFESAVNY